MLVEDFSVTEASSLTPSCEVGAPLTLGQLFAATEQLSKAGQSAVAIGLYQEWLADNAQPLRHLAFFNLGSLLQSIGEADGALTAYQNC